MMSSEERLGGLKSRRWKESDVNSIAEIKTC